MESSIVRQRYARRPVVARRRKRMPQARHAGMKQTIGRQTVICLILLVMVAIIKNIHISAANFVTDQVKYILSYNTELKNVFSYMDKLASDIKNSVTKAANGDYDATEEMQEDTTTAPDASQGNEAAVTEAAKTASEQDGESSKKGTIIANSSIENKTAEEVSYTGATGEKSETAVLSASSESMTSDVFGMLEPVDGTLSTLYGERTVSATGNVKIHKGIDISVKEAGNVNAALEGVVTATGLSREYGAYIEIRHSNSMKTIYANCSSLNSSEGDNVKRGDIIASIGGAGTAAGSHLHFEVWVDGAAVDPLEYINIPVR
ncbi:MAG: M23 family metallopeptidase [Clostridiaceae bacterium]